MAVDSTVGHGEPLAEFMNRALAMPWCSKCGGQILGMSEAAIEIASLRAELAECRKELARVPMLLRHYADSTNGQRAIAAQKLAAFFDQRYAALAAKGE